MPTAISGWKRRWRTGVHMTQVTYLMDMSAFPRWQRMLGGIRISEKSLEHAREMIEEAGEQFENG
jgi:DNA repair ATPase RecN